MPTLRPEGRWMSGAGGAPDAGSVPNPPPRGTPYAPAFPDVFGEQPPTLSGGMSAEIGNAPPAQSEVDALLTMVAGRPEVPKPTGLPAAPPPPAGETDSRTVTNHSLTPEMLARVRERQGIGPFPARPEFPGALPAADNPYDDPSRPYDPPGHATMANEGMGVFEGTPAPTPEPDMVIGNINYSGPEMATTRAAPTQGAVMEPDPGLGPYSNMAVMDPLAAGARMEDVVGPSPTDRIISEALLSSAGQIGGLPDLNVSGGAAWGETYEQDPTLLTDIGLFDTRPTPGRSPATLSLDAMREFSLPATTTSEPDVFDQIIQSEIGPVSSAAPPSADAVIGPYAMQRAGGSADLIRSLTADAYANGNLVPPEPPSTVSLVGGGPRELASDIGSYNSGLWATAPADDIISRAEGWLQRESPMPDYASIPQGDADWSPSMANAAGIEADSVIDMDEWGALPGNTVWDETPVADPDAPSMTDGFPPLVATPAPVEYAQPQAATVDQVIAQPAAGGGAAGGQAAPRRGGLAGLFGGGGSKAGLAGAIQSRGGGTTPGGQSYSTGVTTQTVGGAPAGSHVLSWRGSGGTTITAIQNPDGTYSHSYG